MVYDKLIEGLSCYPLDRLMKVADYQDRDDSVLCFAPWCEGTQASLRIYKDRSGGVYENRMPYWKDYATGRSGYGAVELQAATMGLSLEGDNLQQVLSALSERIGFDKLKEEQQRALRVDTYKGEVPAQAKTTFQILPDFTPQHLHALGCSVVWSQKEDSLRYLFGSSQDDEQGGFDPQLITKEFRLYPVSEVTTEQKQGRGKTYSLRYISAPWNPIFVCLYDDFKGVQKAAGRVLFPCHPDMDFCFSNVDDPSREAFSRRMGGDRVWYEWRKRCTKGKGSVPAAVEAAQCDEQLEEYQMRWEEKDDEPGEYMLCNAKLKAEEQRVHNLVHCQSIYDAVATFFSVRALRLTYQLDADLSQLYLHVCFPYGLRGDFTNRTYSQMRNFATQTFIMPTSDGNSQRKALAVCRRFRSMLRAVLPETFRSQLSLRYPTCYGHEPQSARDLFLCHQMTEDEQLQYDRDIRKYFLTTISSALSANPFVRKEKREKKTGRLTEEYFEIDSASIWEFMGTEGYCRDVKQNDTNKIGRFVHLRGPFADELDGDSMVAVTDACLDEYARAIARPGTDDYAKMKRAITKCKDVNKQTIAKLPSINVDYGSGYGRDVEHFFFKNGVLRITQEQIVFLSYSDINFNVDNAEVMDWNFRMPQGGMPFTYGENQEYLDRKALLEEHRKDSTLTLKQISIEENELEQWKADNRWHFDFQKDWATLKVLIGFANEDWEEEEQCLRNGQPMPKDKQNVLYGHFANILFALGRMLWRYRTSRSNCIPYLMENKAQNGRAEGGSGKSTLVNLFAATCGKVLVIDCRKYITPEDQNKQMGNYRHHCYRIVHFEDQTAGVEHLYNYTTSGFTYERKFEQPVFIPLKEAPAIVCSSNYALKKTDDSSVRRVCMTGFSHRFCGANIMKNKAARLISDVMPGFNTNLELWSDEDRCQCIMLCALAVQFVMRYDEKIEAPQEDVRNRTQTNELGESFVRFARIFFGNPLNFGAPIDLNTAMDEYIYSYCDTSDERKEKYTLKNFRQRIDDYCESNGILCNPDNLYPSENLRARRYFRRKAWCVCHYFEGKDWEGDNTVHSKRVRQPDSSSNVVYFFRNGEEPKDRDALEQLTDRFWQEHGIIDPDPIMDEQGNPEVLTEEEKERWHDYLARRQNRRKPSTQAPNLPTASGEVEQTKDADLPF